jgi:dsDNA-specific endonuclease/ATPase MutS2
LTVEICCLGVSRHAAFLTHAVCAAARLDALNARFLLAKKTSGRRVEVREEGTVDVEGLRHPLLVSRIKPNLVSHQGS